MPRVITLTTDFGSVYAAQVKAVLSSRAPQAAIVELANDLPVHRIAEAAFLLRQMAHGFPSGTVHLAVVDPGVGGSRPAVAAELEDGSMLVGPGNGLLEPLGRAKGIVRVHRIIPERIAGAGAGSATFDGRDVFAPAAAELANGGRVGALGPASSLGTDPIPAARRAPGGCRGVVVHIDRFGDVITNLPGVWLPAGARAARVRLGSGASRSLPVHRTYEDGALGAPALLVSSFGTLEVSVREGRADRRFRARVGSPVRLDWLRGRHTTSKLVSSVHRS